MKTIFLSLGHNKARNIHNWYLQDVGAIDPKTKVSEYSITKEIADEFIPLEKKYTVIRVTEGLSLEQRIKWINERFTKGDIAIELHMNSGGGTGSEIFYNQKNEGNEKPPSEKFIKKFSEELGIKNRFAKPDTATRFGQLGFCRDIPGLSLLIEVGFIDNAEDTRRAKNWGAKVLNTAIQTLL